MTRFDTSTRNRRMPARGKVTLPFIPYPDLWNALHDEPKLREALKGMTFDGMTDISKLMATEGIDAAKDKLRQVAAAPDRKRAAA